MVDLVECATRPKAGKPVRWLFSRPSLPGRFQKGVKKVGAVCRHTYKVSCLNHYFHEGKERDLGFNMIQLSYNFDNTVKGLKAGPCFLFEILPSDKFSSSSKTALRLCL